MENQIKHGGLDLEKKLTKGSLRWIGKNFKGFEPQRLVIGAKNIDAIVKKTALKCYKLKRYKIENVLVIYDYYKILYIYVNPNYKNYRRAFKKIIGTIPKDFDIDHVCAKNLIRSLDYNYVLLCMIPKSVNRKHGHFEKITKSADFNDEIPNIIYANNRIYDKILSRYPKARRNEDELTEDFSPDSKPDSGLTLKQKGMWNSSFGFHLINKERLVKLLDEFEIK